MIFLIAYALEIITLLFVVVLCFLIFRYLIRSRGFARFVANTKDPGRAADLEADLNEVRGAIGYRLREGESEGEALQREHANLLKALRTPGNN